MINITLMITMIMITRFVWPWAHQPQWTHWHLCHIGTWLSLWWWLSWSQWWWRQCDLPKFHELNTWVKGIVKSEEQQEVFFHREKLSQLLTLLSYFDHSITIIRGCYFKLPREDLKEKTLFLYLSYLNFAVVVIIVCLYMEKHHFMFWLMLLFLLALTGALIVMMCYYIFSSSSSNHFCQIFIQSIDAIDVSSVTLSRLNGINAIHLSPTYLLFIIYLLFPSRKHFQFERLVLKSIYSLPPENTLSVRVMPQQKRFAPEEF